MFTHDKNLNSILDTYQKFKNYQLVGNFIIYLKRFLVDMFYKKKTLLSAEFVLSIKQILWPSKIVFIFV